MRKKLNRFGPRLLARCWPLLVLCGGLLFSGGARAARSSDDQTFSFARSLFQDHQYALAETNLSAYLSTYTESSNRVYAILYLARARIEQSNYDGGIQLLTSALPQAGPLADEYAFWAASARLGKGDLTRAAASFTNFVTTYTNSPRRLEAAYDLARVHALMEDWPGVIDILQNPRGVYRQLIAADPKNNFGPLGSLLLGEALLNENKFAEGEKVVGAIDSSNLDPEWQWRRLYLLCRLQSGAGSLALALTNSASLLDSASGPRHQAAGRFLRGQILEKMGRPTEALAAYTNNLADTVPPEDQRQALLKTVGLILAQNQMPDAVQFLENYVAARTNGPALDLAHLSLGELYLRMHYTPSFLDKSVDPTVIDTLAVALSNFDTVITNFPASPVLPQARLDRGWCYWAQTNLNASKADFYAAAETLPLSPEQAVARFKLADTQFSQHEYGAALTNYDLILQRYVHFPSVTNGLYDQALYQIVEANLAQGDDEGALAALQKILDWYPNSLFGDRGQLLIGQSKRYDYTMARQVFSDVLKRSPKSPLRALAQYDIARTYEQQSDWKQALAHYNQWLEEHGTNAPLLTPKVEYARALVCGKAGMESNALTLFTNFVARYPSNNLAPWAQNWVADYYFNRGDNQKAEENYQELFQNFPDAGDLPYQARLMAGRAALARQDTADARQYFSDLVAKTNAPANLVSQAYFALGDTIFLQFISNPSNLTNLDAAITAISTQTNGAPTNALAAQAYGRLGDCYMYWADTQWDTKHDPTLYAHAAQMYQSVLNFPSTNLDVSTRSQAEVALGRIAERQNRPREALQHYDNVLYSVNPDQFDPYWIEQAGWAASQIYRHDHQSDQAIKVLQRVRKAVPALAASLDKAIIEAQTESEKELN